MELLEGRSLLAIQRDEAPLDWRRIFEIAGRICAALAPVHARGSVVGALRADNIYIVNRPGEPEVVELLEQRIAEITENEEPDPKAPRITAVDQRMEAAVTRKREKMGLVGDLSYLSPEQLMGKLVDARTDIFTIGVLIYELITGARPFPDDRGPAALITAMLKQTLTAPSASIPSSTMSAAADEVVMKCLDKDRNRRFSDVTELGQAIAIVLAGGRQTLRGMVAPSGDAT